MTYSFAVDELYLICSIISEDHLRLFYGVPPLGIKLPVSQLYSSFNFCIYTFDMGLTCECSKMMLSNE